MPPQFLMSQSIAQLPHYLPPLSLNKVMGLPAIFQNQGGWEASSKWEGVCIGFISTTV